MMRSTQISPSLNLPGYPDLLTLYLYPDLFSGLEWKRRVPSNIGRDAHKSGSRGPLCYYLALSF